jgi:transposase
VNVIESSSERSEADENVALKRALALAHLQIQDLKAQLRLALIKKYGPGSEKLSDAQLNLLGFEPGVSNVEVQAESVREPLPASTNRKPRPHPGRQELPADLPRVERVIACPPEQCTCSACGQPTAVIGYDVSEQLDVEPAKYFVVVTKREKRACKHCQESGVAAAPAPARIIEKSLVSDQVVINTVIAKYSDHLPLYRQSVILEREAGVEISRATMDGWVMRVGELLIPIAETMGWELLGGSYIQADETTVDVQMHDGRGQNHQAYLWQYGTPGGGVVFDFRLGRGRDGPKKVLGQFEGILQTDGYSAYDHVGGPKMVHAACWAHARRKFFEATQLNPSDVAATRIVRLIDDLFSIDAQAREQNLDHAARQALRLEWAKPLVEVIRGEVEAARELHALAVAEAHALPGVSRVGTEQQPGGELNAPGGSWSEELDPRRKPAGRAESGGHSVHRGELPPAEDSDPGILGRCSARPRGYPDSAACGTHALSLGSREQIAPTTALSTL